MKRTFAFAALALCAALPVAADSPKPNPNSADGNLEADGWKSYDMTWAPSPKGLALTCFAGAPTPVSGTSMPLPSKSGGVAIAPEDFAIGVDTNGDGKVDERLKSDGATCTVTLTWPDGKSTPYMIRVSRNAAKVWCYERSGCWGSTVNKVPVMLIDQNNNGVYDENGLDAISIGGTGYAIPMSRVIAIGDAIYSLKVDKKGEKIWLKAFDGEFGKLDVVSGYKTTGKLLAAVFQSGDCYVNAVGREKASPCPAGDWKLVGGEVGSTSSSLKATIRSGAMKPVAVTKDGVGTANWGMEVHIVFKYTLTNGKLTVKGDDVKARGAAGEEYSGFKPVALTPEFVIWKDDISKPVARGGCPVCPRGVMDDFKQDMAGDGPWKIQAFEVKLEKLFGKFSSEVIDIK